MELSLQATDNFVDIGKQLSLHLSSYNFVQKITAQM
jgi:hypothetical protein